MTRDVRRQSPRMFTTELFERFSRAHPLTPAIIYLPIFAASLWLAVQRQAVLPALLSVFAGYLVWTVTEYWLHRLLFHLKVIGPISARIAFIIHGVHHESPWDETRLVMPAGASIAMSTVIYAVFRLVLGPMMWAPFAGFVIGYIIYDETHWYLHAGRPKSRIGRWMRRQHLLHHFKDHGSRFGVSCPWLDYVFGTRGAPSQAARRLNPDDDSALDPAE